MATSLIAYPFQLSPAGAVVTTDEGTDFQLAGELAVAVLTRPGERPLVPTFGIADPAFVGFDEEALRLHVETFGPAVTVESVDVQFLNPTTQNVVVNFSANG